MGQWRNAAGLTNVTAISSGGIYNSDDDVFALESNGTLLYWAGLSPNTFVLATGLSNVVEISCGGYHGLTLGGNGLVYPWVINPPYGSNYGQTLVPPGLTNVYSVSAGGYHSLAIEAATVPMFNQQPEPQTVYSGYGASFSVVAMAPQPPTYQWQLNGSNIPGATNVVLNLAAAQPANAGEYRVAVGNGFGTNFSIAAALTVLTNSPVILTQPVPQTVVSGATVVFSTSATGPIPIGYQWQFNSSNIAGATNSWLTLTNVALTNGGYYSVLVGNPYAQTTSSNALLTVVDPSNFNLALNDTNLVWTTGYPLSWSAEIAVTHDGMEAASSAPFTTDDQVSTLQTTVTGPGTLSFWYYETQPFTLSLLDNGTNLSQYTATSWQRAVVYLGTGTHVLQWQAESIFGPSCVAYLDQVSYVPGATLPTITSAPAPAQNVAAGSAVTFSVGVIGTPLLLYQWQFDGQNLAGATNASLTLSDVQATNAGNYSLIVSNNTAQPMPC